MMPSSMKMGNRASIPAYLFCIITIVTLVVEGSAKEKCPARYPEEQRALGEKNLRSGINVQEAIACFREALSKVEKTGNIQEKGELQGLLIDAFDAVGDSSSADKMIKRMMSDFPRSPVPFFKIGNQYRSREKWADAVKSYRKALELHPAFTSALVNLAMCYRSMRQFDDSIATYRLALIESPDRADIYVNFGVVLDSAGKV
jgi:tetratricopeptide (TPR) repeat protein